MTNLCPCDVALRRTTLTLKYVAHIGEVATQTIKPRRTLVGIDVTHMQANASSRTLEARR